jgi:hypothetical protein
MYSRKPKALPLPKKKSGKLTLAEIKTKFRNYRRSSYCMVDDFPEQCGMAIITNLHGSHMDSIHWILDALYAGGLSPDDRPIKSQVIISDIVSRAGNPTEGTSMAWYEVKKVCIKKGMAGPVTKNPNTFNYVRHFTITEAMIEDIYNYYK